MIRQQLQGELKNVPADASQVCRSTTCSLNKEETLSVSGGCGSMTYNKLTCNNPEVNLQDAQPGSRKLDFVLNANGKTIGISVQSGKEFVSQETIHNRLAGRTMYYNISNLAIPPHASVGVFLPRSNKN